MTKNELFVRSKELLDEARRSKREGARAMTLSVEHNLPFFAALADEFDRLEEGHLNQLIRGHDWYYQQSDDYTAYCNGARAQKILVKAFQNAIHQARAKHIWDRYAPKGFNYYDGTERND